jgi:hypothetical protein
MSTLLDYAKIKLIEQYLIDLDIRIQSRYQGSEFDQNVGYGYEIVSKEIKEILDGELRF